MWCQRLFSVHNHLACLFLSVRDDVLNLLFFRLFPTSLKTFAPKNRLHFPYSIAPLLGVPFPLLLTFSIFLHHEKISHLQYFVAFSTVYNYVHQRYYSISLAILAPFVLPSPHTSACLNVLFSILFSHTFAAIFHPLLFLQPISLAWWIPHISYWFTSLMLHSHLFNSGNRSIYLEVYLYITKYTHPLQKTCSSLNILSHLKMKPSWFLLLLQVLQSICHQVLWASLTFVSSSHLYIRQLSTCPTQLDCYDNLLELLQMFSFG